MVDSEILVSLYKTMMRIRLFEEKIVQLYAQGFIPGHVHLYIGEEPVAAGICAHLKDDDYIFTTHRPHGHMIAKGGEFEKMLIEVFGKYGGYNKGKGGHMHLSSQKIHLVSTAIVGGGLGPAIGTALAQKYNKTKDITVCFFGDGAANQGLLYEAMNMSMIWQLPLIFVCENNRYAISTPVEVSMGGPGYAERAKAFGIKASLCDGYNPEEMYQTGKDAVDYTRTGKGPVFLEVKTYRLRGHREGDPQTYRKKEEIIEWKKKDPVKTFKAKLLEDKIITPEEEAFLVSEIEAEIETAVERAKTAPYPEPEVAGDDVYSEKITVR
jgi:pyruvate dehydrogenase E1 component alpha subunit